MCASSSLAPVPDVAEHISRGGLSVSREAVTDLCTGVAAAMPTLSRVEQSALKPAKRRRITRYMRRKKAIMEMTTCCCDIKCTIQTDSNCEKMGIIDICVE